MLTPLLRSLLVFSSLGLGLREVVAGRPVGWLFVAGAVLLAAGHFFYGSVRAAFVALRRGDLARAQKLIERTPMTRLLTSESRAYRHWVLAALAEARGKLDVARDELRAAIDQGLRTMNDRVLALGTLAAVHAKLGERDAATKTLAEAEALGPGTRVRALLAKVRAQLG